MSDALRQILEENDQAQRALYIVLKERGLLDLMDEDVRKRLEEVATGAAPFQESPVRGTDGELR